MNKCFITKLPSSIDNNNLPVLGQLKINVLKQSTLTNNESRCIALSTNDNITVNVYGAHFTDSKLTSTVGNTKTITAADGVVYLFISNDTDAVLTIDNKYSLTMLAVGNSVNVTIDHPIYFDIDDIKYCTNLTRLELTKCPISGDISVLNKLTNLTSLNLTKTNINGNISEVSNFTNLTALRLSSSQISGNIDSLASLTKLDNLEGLKYMSLTGDMSKIPANINFISQQGRKIDSNFTWTAGGRQNATLLAMEGAVPFDTVSMDNMLIAQATCTFKSTAAPWEKTISVWEKTISVNGTRTSASDAAVAAIQNMGVTITGVTKQD